MCLFRFPQVSVDKLGLNALERQVFIDLVGSRYHGTGDVHLIANRFPNRIENKRYLVFLLENLVAEAKRLAVVKIEMDLQKAVDPNVKTVEALVTYTKVLNRVRKSITALHTSSVLGPVTAQHSAAWHEAEATRLDREATASSGVASKILAEIDAIESSGANDDAAVEVKAGVDSDRVKSDVRDADVDSESEVGPRPQQLNQRQLAGKWNDIASQKAKASSLHTTVAKLLRSIDVGQQ